MEKKIIAAACSVSILCGGFCYLPYNAENSEITAYALSCSAPRTIAWQQDSTSRSQIDQYLTGVNYWNTHIWKNVGSKHTIGGSACGIFSLINSVYAKTGNFLDPISVADWATANGFGTSTGVGTGFFKKYSETFGEQYGFYFAGQKTSVSSALEHVRSGGTICANVPGHWVAVVDYNASTNKYLLLDSSAASSRYSTISGQEVSRGSKWVDESSFKSGKYQLFVDGRTVYSLSYKGATIIAPPTADDPKPSDPSLPWNFTYPTRNLKQKSPYMNGDDVKWLQSALSYLGYTCTVDGKLGPATAKQIRQYQSDKGLKVDGIAGSNTLQSLKNDAEAKKNGASNGITSNTNLFTNLFTMGQRAMEYVQGNLLRGDDVKWAQAALNKLIGANLVVDGIFGPKTSEQVKIFQASQGIYKSGIIVGRTLELIQQMLNDENYTPPQQSMKTILRYGYSEPTGNLKNGSKGDTVRWLQVALNNTIDAGLNVDGHYGPKTVSAVKSFQSKYGLSSDGIFGAKSLAKMKEVLASKNITICGGTEIPSTAILSLGKNKLYYAEEESILLEFDSDTGEKFKVAVFDSNGNVVYDYITEEYNMSIALPPGEYRATLTASNDLGAAISDSIEFTVIKQSMIMEQVTQICSADYGYALAYDNTTNTFYTTLDAPNESFWNFVSYDDWTFDIYNTYNGGKLIVDNGNFALDMKQEAETTGDWYLYEENGISVIKSFYFDTAITISSKGELSLKPIDTTSNAQSIAFSTNADSKIIPHIENIDDTHAEISWKNVEGAENYCVYVYDTLGVTDDGLFEYIETTDNSCTITLPNSEYEICIEATVNDYIIVRMGMDESEEAPTTPQEPEDDQYNELISYAVQLQRFLLGCDDGYSPSVINSLDMNSDSRIDVYDFILLKRFIIEEGSKK